MTASGLTLDLALLGRDQASVRLLSEHGIPILVISLSIYRAFC